MLFVASGILSLLWCHGCLCFGTERLEKLSEKRGGITPVVKLNYCVVSIDAGDLFSFVWNIDRDEHVDF